MGDPTVQDYPTVKETAYKLATGQAGEVIKDVGSKLFRDFTAAAKRAGEAMQRTLNATEAPSLPTTSQSAHKVVTGQAGDVVLDVAERALWEAGQFVTNTAETVRNTLGQATAPVVPTASQSAYKFVTGQAGDVVSDLAKRGLWEAGQFAEHTADVVKNTLASPVAPTLPTASQSAYKVAAGQAGDVMGDLAKRGLWEAGQFVEHTADAVTRTLNQTAAPVVPGASEATYKVVTGQASGVITDLAKRGLWEVGQFVENAGDVVMRTINQPVAPEVMGGKEAASKFIAGQGGEVASNIGGRALWEVGQFAKHTVESIYGTGTPAATAPAEASPKDTAPKTRAPGSPGSGKP